MTTPVFLDDAERTVLHGIASLADANPFLAERVESEKRALGDAFLASAAPWHADAEVRGLDPNVPLLLQAIEDLAAKLRDRLEGGARATDRELEQYEALIHYLLFHRCQPHFYELVDRRATATADTKGAFESFAREVKRFLGIPGVRTPGPADAAHLFALGFQVRRAFHHTFHRIYGGSEPAARLRAAVWQSVFTHDRKRYIRSLYPLLGDVTTLVVGESGTGKELVAQAIAFSRYVPYDARKHAFAEDWAGSFGAVNLSALSPTLIESELFGHRRGAFTGALEDRAGYLETCGASGTVFLDEIGDLSPEIQVKLLRVLQERTFQRIGETKERPFRGKIIAATNRDLPEEIRSGRFRHDLYYRLCADVVRTPTLREQLADHPEDLRNLILILAQRVAGRDERETLTEEVFAWVSEHVRPDYPWPGNIRELEQCVRNILIRGHYETAAPVEEPVDAERLLAPALSGKLTADELLRRYCTYVYSLTGSYLETGRRLAIDRRTVRAKIDRAALKELRRAAEEDSEPS